MSRNTHLILLKILLNVAVLALLSAFLLITLAWQSDIERLDMDAQAASVDIVTDSESLQIALSHLSTEQPFEQMITFENSSTVPTVVVCSLSAANETAKALLANGYIEYALLDSAGQPLSQIPLSCQDTAFSLYLQISLKRPLEAPLNDEALFNLAVTARQVEANG